MMSDDCIFCKIVDGKVPSNKFFEDSDLMAFHDIRPVAPVHFLIIPKMHIESLNHFDATHQELLGKMFLLAPKLAAQFGLKGFRTMINTGHEGGQEVFHMHVHVFGGGANLPKT
jgi:histidine triad (HIT) family protein